MRPSAAPECDHGDGAPARDRGAARPSGALTQVPSTAPNPQIPSRAPRSARAPLTLRPTPAAALVQPGRACAEPADRPVLARAGGLADACPLQDVMPAGCYERLPVDACKPQPQEQSRQVMPERKSVRTNSPLVRSQTGLEKA